MSKQYNVSLEALKELNPDLLIDGLKIGMVIRIPKEKMLSLEEERQNELDYWAEHFILHTVVKDNTVYRLTRDYNVSEENLLELNPTLSEGLKLGMVLKIKEIISEEDLKEFDKLVLIDSIVTKDTIDIAMLLPFKFKKNDTLSKEQLFTAKNNLVSVISDFYLGASIAIDSIKNQGVCVNVKVYDTENNRDTIRSLIKSKKFEKTDVVFGPVFNWHVNHLAAELKGVPVVFPFYSSKQNNFVKDNIIKTATSREVLKEKVLTYFSQIYTGENILVVGDEKLNSKKEFEQIGAFLKEHNDSIQIEFLQPDNGYISKDRFVKKVDTLGVNWVILTSNNKVVTADVINNLKSIPNEAEVRLFAFEKKDNFTKVDNNLLADLNFVYASSGVLVDSLPGVSNFYAQYLKKNKDYPSIHASKGFDVVYDVLIRMASNDSLHLQSSFNKGMSKRVISTFNYQQKAYGGPAYNTAVYLRKFNKDLSIDVLYLKKEPESEPESELDLESEKNAEIVSETSLEQDLVEGSEQKSEQNSNHGEDQKQNYSDNALKEAVDLKEETSSREKEK